MERSLRRRSLLAAVGAVGLAGCTALGGESDDGLEDDDRDDQEESSDAIEVERSSILVEDQLVEISVRRWTEVETIRYLDTDTDELREVEPERGYWSQLTVAIDDLRGTDVSTRLETPAPDAVRGAVIATGELLEPVASYAEIVDGLSSREVRDDVRILAKPQDPYQGDTTWISPLFDSPVPADEIAVDVGGLLERDSEIWLEAKSVR